MRRTRLELTIVGRHRRRPEQRLVDGGRRCAAGRGRRQDDGVGGRALPAGTAVTTTCSPPGRGVHGAHFMAGGVLPYMLEHLLDNPAR
jgi:hypothetical protein